MEPKIKLGIIGTAGRSDKDILNASHFKLAIKLTKEYITNILNTSFANIILVSGGSAWMDHVAVYLFLTEEFAGIELYLPCEFDIKNNMFDDSHEGKTLNKLHNEFTKKISSFDSLTDLSKCIKNNLQFGIEIIIKKGFFNRNTYVATNSDHILAFTFAKDTNSITGGTKNTWDKIKHDNKIHYTLQ